ncbi:MAG: hypothetical protein ACKKMS_02090 [Candidatus Nealsonbacteria bacterium]
MEKYALEVNDPLLRIENLFLYIEKESLHKGEEIILKRRQVKSWRKDIKAINKLFLKKGKSEKIRDRIDNYEIKFRIGNEMAHKALEGVPGSYQGFSASIV